MSSRSGVRKTQWASPLPVDFVQLVEPCQASVSSSVTDLSRSLGGLNTRMNIKCLAQCLAVIYEYKVLSTEFNATLAVVYLFAGTFYFERVIFTRSCKNHTERSHVPDFSRWLHLT